MTRHFHAAKDRGDNLRLVAFYHSDRAEGVAWIGLIGGAFLVGPLDQEGKISGEECIYIYPDLKTVLCGRFKGSQLVSGYASTIVGVRVANEILVPVVAKETMGAARATVTRDISTNQRISK